MIKDITKKFLGKENNCFGQMTSPKILDFLQKHNDFQIENIYSMDDLEMINIISKNQILSFKNKYNRCNYRDGNIDKKES